MWLAALLVLVGGHFWFPPLRSGAAHDTYSVSAVGKKAFYLLTEQHAWFAWRNDESLIGTVEYLSPESTVCILGPARYPTEPEWEALLDWVALGGRLVFAAREDTDRVKIPGLNTTISPYHGRTSAIPSDADEVGSTLLVPGEDGATWRSGAEIVGDSGELLVNDGDTRQAVRIRHGQGRIILIATDHIFTNEALTREDNPILAFRLIEAAGYPSEVVFDESLNLTGTPRIVSLLLDPLLRPLTLQLLIGLVVFGWWQSRRFGPLIPQALRPRHNIVDHTDAVGLLSFRTGDGQWALRAYLRQIIGELRLKTHKGKETRVLGPIARRLNTSEDSLRNLFRRATTALRERNVDRRVAAEFIQRLARVRRAAAPQTVRSSKPSSTRDTEHAS